MYPTDDLLGWQRFDKPRVPHETHKATTGGSPNPCQDVVQTHRQDSNADSVPLVCTWNQQLPPPSHQIEWSFPILQENARLHGVFKRPPVRIASSRTCGTCLLELDQSKQTAVEQLAPFLVMRKGAKPALWSSKLVLSLFQANKKSSLVAPLTSCTPLHAQPVMPCTSAKQAVCCGSVWMGTDTHWTTDKTRQWQNAFRRRITTWQFASSTNLKST